MTPLEGLTLQTAGVWDPKVVPGVDFTLLGIIRLMI